MITSSTSGGGKGGNITITCDSVTIEGDASDIELQEPLRSQSDFRESSLRFQKEHNSGIYSRTEGKAPYAGEAGEIRISASELTLSRKGRISTSSTGQGRAGRIILDADNLRIGENAAIYSAGESANFRTFSDISEQDSHTFVMGDMAEVADIGDGRAATFFFIGKEWKRFNNNYAVANETELSELSGRYSLLDGDIAEVADAADGQAGSFVYEKNRLEVSGEWIRFDRAAPVATVDNQGELDGLDGYSPSVGDVVRVADYEDGKTADLVYTGYRFEALNNYTVADMAELSGLHGSSEYLEVATKVTVLDAGGGEPAVFIYKEFWRGGERRVDKTKHHPFACRFQEAGKPDLCAGGRCRSDRECGNFCLHWKGVDRVQRGSHS